MKVILLEDIKKLGNKGKVVEVKDGFARNYLLPRGKALEATENNILLLKRKEEREKRLKEKEKEDALKRAESIAKLSLTIPCPAKNDEELFGSVTAQMIASILTEEGYPIDKDCVLLEEPIKKLGIYKIRVRLHPEVESEFKLWVVKK